MVKSKTNTLIMLQIFVSFVGVVVVDVIVVVVVAYLA